MARNSPTPEPAAEIPSEQRLIQLLKERGPEDPETRDLLASWTDAQERKVELLVSNPVAYRTEQIQLNLRRARLYFEAGYVEAAAENFEDARTQAYNEEDHELYRAIMAEMDEKEL